MGRVLTRFIEDPMVYACANCKTHLSTEENIESKEFHTANGRGFLIKNVINVTNGPPDERVLRTGRHTCEDVYCVTCDTMVGWEYVRADGRMVVDTMCVVLGSWGWFRKPIVDHSTGCRITVVSCGTLAAGKLQMWAFDKGQKYKVGKFVLEAVKVMRYHWEGDD